MTEPVAPWFEEFKRIVGKQRSPAQFEHERLRAERLKLGNEAMAHLKAIHVSARRYFEDQP